jgi:hypothetical protein
MNECWPRHFCSYVCSKDVTSYKQFGSAQKGECPFHDNVEDWHMKEVREAARAAIAKIRSEHHERTGAEFMVKVSDRVKREDRNWGERARANPFHRYPLGR